MVYSLEEIYGMILDGQEVRGLQVDESFGEFHGQDGCWIEVECRYIIDSGCDGLR